MNRPAHSFSENEALSAQASAYQFIRDQIMSGSYVGGTKLQPDRIAEEIGISRMPVREALRQLEAEGLVTVRPNKRAVVTSLSSREIQEIFEIRAALEGLAANKAAERATEDDIEELKLLCAQLQRAKLSSRDWLLRHHQFHDFAAEISGQKRLVKEIQRIRASVDPYLLYYINSYRKAEMSGAEHLALVDAIRSRNSLLTERAFGNHVMSASKGVIASLESAREHIE